MPRNGSGQYSAPTNSWNPAINGVPATAADWQAVLNDIVSAMTQSVSRDGQTAMTGNLPMAGNKVTGLGNATAAGDAPTFAQLFSQGQQQDVPAAATTDIGAQLSTLINVTGAATITSFGTNYNGPRFLRFAGVCTLTNSATLVLPSGANLTTAAGDSLIAVPLGNPATGWRVVASSGSSLVGYRPSGTGAVATNVQSKLREFVSVKDFGAVGDGVTDDTAAIQAAITYVGSQDAFTASVKGLQLDFATNGKYYVAGTLYLPSFVRINLNGSTIIGRGTNTLFESAYFSGGVPVTNFGQPNETQFVVCSSVTNGQISNVNRAFNLFNFCEGSKLEGLRLFGCNQAVYARRCFYSSVVDVHSRSPLDGLRWPCFHFDDAANAIRLQHNFAVGYLTGWEFSGSKDNIYAIDCGAEHCTKGVVINSNTSAIQFRGWYFELLTTAIDFEATGNHSNIYVDGCWFNSVTTAIEGTTIVSGRFSQNNVLNGAVISLAGNFSNRMVVEIPTDVSAANTFPVPALPANYQLGDSNIAEYVKTIFDSATGLVTNKGKVYGGIIPHAYSGDSGSAPANTIPFCTTTFSAGSLTVDTRIRYRVTEFIGLQLTIPTAGGEEVITGIYSAGIALALAKSVAITVTATNNAGFYRFTVTGLVAATSFSGVVRIL